MKAATSVVLIALVVVAAGCRRQAPPPPVVSAPPPAPAAAQPVAGEPVAAPATVDAVAEIAAYPAATQLARSEKVNKGGFAKIVEVKLHSTDAFTNVKAFYANVITAGGWQVTASKEKADEVEWSLSKGTAVARIELDTKSTGGVEISIERKDR